MKRVIGQKPYAYHLAILEGDASLAGLWVFNDDYALALRDMGWLLFWVTTPHEALEHVLLGYRIAEDARVRMPIALAMDGAFLTHSQHML